MQVAVLVEKLTIREMELVVQVLVAIQITMTSVQQEQ